MIQDLTAERVAERLRDEDPPLLLDVREPWECAVAPLADAINIPMGEIPSRLRELPSDRDVVVVCHHGVRSFQVALWLSAQGFDRVANLSGGIDAWSKDVDSSIPTY